MEFKCSGCDYVSTNKHCVLKHINKTNKCKKDVELKILTVEVDIICEFCNKQFNTKPSMNRHQKVCKVKKTNIEKELEIEKQKNKDLEKEVEILKAIASKPSIGTQNNIMINLTSYNNPNLKDIDKHLKASAKKLFLAVPTIIEKIHFNEEMPENHNIVIKNARTKIAKVFNGKKWTTIDEEQLLDELVETYESLLIEYANENGSNYFEKMNKIKFRDSEEKVYSDMKVEVKKVLYDNRDMVKC